ncbi:rod shape-determining protein RodA [Pseudomonadota bacterium]
MYYRNDSLVVKLFKLDWNLILAIFLLFLSGVVMLYSAAGGNFKPWAYKQVMYFFIFFPVMLGIAVIDINKWFKVSYIIYGAALLLLIMVTVKGYKSMGAVRWIRFGVFNLQPSEIMKLCLVLALAKYFENLDSDDIKKTSAILIPIFLIIIPVILIIKQPDLGTSLIVFAIGIALLFLTGIQMWKFNIAGILGVIGVPFVWRFLMHDYQRRRILTFINPGSDPLGAGYNITQSKIAIGSGGFLGKGYLKGTQGQLDFLPEKQTDFIFTMLAEEFGFLGGFAVLVVCSYILYKGIKIGLGATTHYGRMVALGIMTIFFLHMFINIAMAMGLIPVVGAPLPLLSYGGTITATMLISFGFLLNIDLYKNTILIKKN